MSLIFLDYLDYKTSNSVIKESFKESFTNKLTKFKWDILSFPKATFLVAAPAIAKCKDTALLMKACESMWKNSRIKYVLSDEYNGNFNLYINKRLGKLEKNFTEKELNSHFEYQGYKSNHWSIIFNELLQSHQPTAPFVSRKKNCDTEFREQVKKDIITDNFAKHFSINTNLDIERSLVDIETLANNNNELFQRENIAKKFMQHLGRIDPVGLIEINSALDNSFATANASAALATISKQKISLDGGCLHIISQGIYVKNNLHLSELITRLTIEECDEISDSKPWKLFILALNNEISNLNIKKKDAAIILRSGFRPISRHMKQKYILSVIISFLMASILPSNDAGKIASSILTDLPSSLASSLCKSISRNLVDITLELIEYLNKYYCTSEQLYFRDYYGSLQYFYQKGVLIQHSQQLTK
ncbi:hypothetical protein KJ656_17715 [bacterium]|nr:hypothetical protein [bacterium]